MDKGTTHNGNDEVEDKYQCPDTGSHFEFLEMCHRLKKLQKRRNVVD
jgi:CCR4-NOT transcriptional regulation complex NOT5 subunit